MREIRLSGSEGGVAFGLSLPLSRPGGGYTTPSRILRFLWGVSNCLSGMLDAVRCWWPNFRDG